MGKNMRMNFFKQRITIVLLLVVGVYIYSSINEFYFFEKDYYEYLLNTFAGITLLTGIAYLCYPKKKANLKNELVLNEYKLEYETESTESQYFISDADAWNTLRKQLATTARGCAVLYIKENCELPIINNTVLAKKRNFDCWKPVCAGKILIIDDEKQMLALLSRILELEGYEVYRAATCKAGLRQLQVNTPEVVLRDVCLPDGNGIELIDRMKNISPSVEIILLTAHGKIEDSVSAIKSSAFDYLVKGDDNNRIFSLIAKEMEKASEAFIVDITTEKQSHLKK